MSRHPQQDAAGGGLDQHQPPHFLVAPGEGSHFWEDSWRVSGHVSISHPGLPSILVLSAIKVA